MQNGVSVTLVCSTGALQGTVLPSFLLTLSTSAPSGVPWLCYFRETTHSGRRLYELMKSLTAQHQQNKGTDDFRKSRSLVTPLTMQGGGGFSLQERSSFEIQFYTSFGNQDPRKMHFSFSGTFTFTLNITLLQLFSIGPSAEVWALQRPSTWPQSCGGRSGPQTHITVKESHISRPGTQLILSESSCFTELKEK